MSLKNKKKTADKRTKCTTPKKKRVLMEMTQLLYYGTLGFIIRIAWVSIVSCQRVVECVCVYTFKC